MCEIEPNLIPEYFNESQQKSNAPQDFLCVPKSEHMLKDNYHLPSIDCRQSIFFLFLRSAKVSMTSTLIQWCVNALSDKLCIWKCNLNVNWHRTWATVDFICLAKFRNSVSNDMWIKNTTEKKWEPSVGQKFVDFI